MTDRRPVSREQARAHRQAAALYRHWRRKGGSEGEMAVLAEMHSDADWTHLVCALLNLGTNMVKAAGDGKADEYLAYAARDSMLDEAMQDD